ncbi:hypothetical protein B0H13DRAFT_2370185 [Mycena leptocephala]|nr:hypothetical protein B0H13DRAFT_2370185 [Mycena leptocephala]
MLDTSTLATSIPSSQWWDDNEQKGIKILLQRLSPTAFRGHAEMNEVRPAEGRRRQYIWGCMFLLVFVIIAGAIVVSIKFRGGNAKGGLVTLK